MAEEDVLYAKNRHFFGGIEPSDMKEFSAISCSDEENPCYVKIVATLPDNTVINGQTVCTVAGAVIRRVDCGYSHYTINTATMINEFGGEEVATITESGIIIDTDVEPGRIYAYIAVPFSKQGVYNRKNKYCYYVSSSEEYINPNCTYAETDTYEYLFGYDLDTTDSNPATRVSYPSNVQNYGFNPAHMDFSADSFDYGSWESVLFFEAAAGTQGRHFMPNPVIKSPSAVYSYRNLVHNDYSKLAYPIGENAPISSTSYDVVMEWPKIYTKRWEENGVYHFRCCDKKLSDDWDCWCNYDVNNNEINEFYTAVYPTYKISQTGTANYSQSGRVPVVAKYGSSYLAQSEFLCDHLLIQDLLVLMARTTDLSAAYGVGMSSTGRTTGATNNKGLFYGTSNGSAPVKVFGMEDYWGGYYTLIDGWYLDVSSGSSVQKVKITPGTHDGSSGTDMRATANFINTNIKWTDGVGYISSMKTFPWGRLPVKLSGSSTTYECDRVSSDSDIAHPVAVNESGPFGANMSRRINYENYTYYTRMSFKAAGQ